MYCFYGKSNRGHRICPLYRGCPPFGEPVIRGFTVSSKHRIAFRKLDITSEYGTWNNILLLSLSKLDKVLHSATTLFSSSEIKFLDKTANGQTN